MRVVVLGAGIAGITTAWYLAEGGAQVTVLDRGAEAASETSHANGGHISTQSAVPWTGPHGIREFVATRVQRERAVRVLPARDPGRWAWFASTLVAARPARYRRAKAAMLELAAYSRDCLETLADEQRLDFSPERSGSLTLFLRRRTFARAARDSRHKRGVQVLDSAETLAVEPALEGARVKPAGALYYPQDATGDCRAFCIDLAGRAAERGVEFRFAVEARGLRLDGRRVRAVVTDAGDIDTDAVVVASGAGAPAFLRPYGIRLPIIPLRGYTLSAPIAAGDAAPGRVVDAERRVVFARLDGVFRAAGMADFAGPYRGEPADRLALLERISRDWYPGLSRPVFWNCLRPMTPDGPPLLGESAIGGVWLNAGLGSLGWTLGCGAGRIVADLVLDRPPAVQHPGLDARRFRSAVRAA